MSLDFAAVPVAPTDALLVLLAAYLVGSIPFAYLIVKLVTGEDIVEHGTGNIGAMNVRRTTGSWGWFTVAMLLDGLKGFVPLTLVKTAMLTAPELLVVPTADMLTTGLAGRAVLTMIAAFGVVLGHNYSLWMALKTHALRRTGKGLATGGGALLVYDWRYFLVVLAVGLLTIAITRYMMAGQVVAAASLPVAALVSGSSDVLFCVLIAGLVIAAHWKRFVGLLRGREPKLYVDDGTGPRG